MKKIILKTSSLGSYTFTGNTKEATFAPSADTDVSFYRMDDEQGKQVFLSAYGSNKIVKARLVLEGAGVSPANATKAGTINLAFRNDAFSSASGSSKNVYNVNVTMAQWNEWEEKNIPIDVDAKEDEWKNVYIGKRPLLVTEIEDNTEFALCDIDVPSGIVGEELDVFLEVEMLVDKFYYYEDLYNLEVPRKCANVGDEVYADADGNVHFINTDSLVTANLPADWEYVGSVALREDNKATILYKTEAMSVKWASLWLFKVNGLKLDGTDTFVLQQGPTSGSTPVEIGTFTASSSATDLDTLVSELDTWLRANPTATGALANYNWHAEKHADANGVDACFIVVDNIDNQSRFIPIKSSTSGASATMYMWDWCGFTTDSTAIKRKDGVMTYAVVWNKERYKLYNTNVNNPTDSLSSTGIYNEAGFNATTTIKGYYGTYDNYLDHMMPDEDATTGAYAMFKGKGKEVAEAIADIVFPNLSGTDTSVFTAEVWATSLKAHSTASVEGLNVGDFYIPSIDELFKIMSAMKIDGSDAVNSALVKAGASKMDIDKSRYVPARYTIVYVWITAGVGYFSYNIMGATNRLIAVAEIDLA